jgi:hypothetical protein
VVAVDLPMDGLARLQTEAGESWPDDLVYRVHTTHGDDFLVDADASRLVLENELGTFAPFLSECRSARPIGDPTGDWRIELVNGSVLIGPLADDAIVFAMPLGPDSVTVPLDTFISMERQDWGAPPTPATTPPVQASPVEHSPARGSGSADWFDNSRLRQVKEDQKGSY